MGSRGTAPLGWPQTQGHELRQQLPGGSGGAVGMNTRQRIHAGIKDSQVLSAANIAPIEPEGRGGAEGGRHQLQTCCCVPGNREAQSSHLKAGLVPAGGTHRRW